MSHDAKLPPEVIEAREKKKFLRTEQQYFKDEENPNPFLRKKVNDKVLLSYLVEILVKSNNLLKLACSSPSKPDELKVLEMSLNKEDLLSKSKGCNGCS